MQISYFSHFPISTPCLLWRAILTSNVTILVSFEAILKRFSVRINFKSQFQSNDLLQALKYIKIASKLTNAVTILANIALAGEHIWSILISITTILTSIVTILASIEEVNTPQVINIHKMFFFKGLKNITWGFFQKIAFAYHFFPSSANQLGIVNLLNSERYQIFLHQFWR